MHDSVGKRTDTSIIDAINKLPTVSVTFRAESDGTLRVENYSAGFCRMVKCTAEEAQNYYSDDPQFHGKFHEQNEELIAFYLAHREDENPVPLTYRLPLVHGGFMWVSTQFHRFEADGIHYLYVVFSDIDELKRHELELQEQYRSAQAFMDSMAVRYMAVRRCNLMSNKVEAISGVEYLTSMEVEKDYDLSISVLLGFIPEPQYKAACAEYYSRKSLIAAFRGGKSVLSMDYQLADEQGSVKWVRSTIHLTRRPEDGDLIAFTTVKDVNDEIMGARLASGIIGRNYAGAAYCDLRSRNFYMRETTGGSFVMMDYGEAMSREIARVDPSQSEEFREKLRLDNIIAALEECPVHSLYFRSGELREDLPGSPCRQLKCDIFYLDERRNILVYLLSDVTAILERDRENREKMEGALVAARQASAAKSNFLSRMSHEIRTPLNAIIGMDTIAAQSVSNPERVADCVSKIGLSARYLLSLINDILDMSRIESGKMLLKNESFLFPEFIGSVNNIIFPQVRGKRIDYECTVSKDVEDSYIGDEMKLQQILVNVLGNAVKFTSKGKISLDISVLNRESDQEKLRFVVSDTGCGIPEENLGRIFDAFEQVDTSTTTVFGGTGLGLAITKNLVELMGGRINVRSIVGIGSEFTIDIPMTVDETVIRTPGIMPNLKDLHALIVDDDLFICEQTEGILESIGMVGEWVTSGQEAVSRVRRKADSNGYYDFILIDWKMPDMDGIETTQKIRRIVGPDVTIIIISAYDWQSIEADARAAGANLMVSKPLLRSTLVSAFEKALGDEKKAEMQKPEFDFSGKRVLVAEDNELNAEIAKSLLENKNFTVEIAPNGIRALEMFVKSPQGYYDAVLMDVRMPMMDGLQATVNIRHWDRPDARTVPIIAMTANAFDEDVEKSRASGMNAHLSKPIDPELLYGTLFRLLEKE